jgi:hypothetical protein
MTGSVIHVDFGRAAVIPGLPSPIAKLDFRPDALDLELDWRGRTKRCEVAAQQPAKLTNV